MSSDGAEKTVMTLWSPC